MSTSVPLKDRVLASLVANISVTLLTNPLDVAKVRAQAYNENTRDAFAAVLQRRGIRGFYSGLVPALCMSIPTVSIYYTTYDAVRPRLEERGLPVTLAGSFGGGLARCCAVVVSAPLELIKTQLQYGAHSHHNHHSTFTALRDLYKGGLLYTGLFANLARDVPFSMTYWLIVETVRRKREGDGSASGPVPLHRQLEAGLCGGVVATILTHPFDVIKTLQQTPASGMMRSPKRKHRECSSEKPVCKHGPDCQVGCRAITPNTHTFVACAQKIYQVDGARGFSVGLLPRLVRVPISCSLMLTSFEAVKGFLAARQSHGHAI